MKKLLISLAMVLLLAGQVWAEEPRHGKEVALASDLEVKIDGERYFKCPNKGGPIFKGVPEHGVPFTCCGKEYVRWGNSVEELGVALPFKSQKALPAMKCSYRFRAVPFSEAEAWSEKPENEGWEPFAVTEWETTHDVIGNPDMFIPRGQSAGLLSIEKKVWFKKRECQ